MPEPPITVDPNVDDTSFSEDLTSDQNVNVGPVADPVAPGLNAEQLSQDWYGEGRASVHYVYDLGVRCCPVAGTPGKRPAIFRVHSGKWWRIRSWTAERVGAWPRLPPMNTNNSNEVLVKADVVPQTPTMTPDGVRVYRLSGTYFYTLFDAPTQWTPGATQWDTATAGDNVKDMATQDTALDNTAGTKPADSSTFLGFATGNKDFFLTP